MRLRFYVLCSLVLISLCCACSLPHPEHSHCEVACTVASRSLGAELSHRDPSLAASAQQNPPSTDPNPACVEQCLHGIVPIEYHCLARTYNANDVQSCFERPRTNAYRLDHLRTIQQDLQQNTQQTALQKNSATNTHH